MKQRFNYKYVFGPVYSWRLGISLGIDPVPGNLKYCSFNCVYCQLGKTAGFCRRRRIFVPTAKIIGELASLAPLKVDYITFSGRGEPTLAKNLGQIIEGIRKIRREKIAVITNASLLGQKEVRRDLAAADVVLAKLDAYDEKSFREINRPGAVHFKSILQGIKKFRREYKGRLVLQIMFIKENKDRAAELARLARAIRPDEVQLNTPLRKSPARPLSRPAMRRIKHAFKAFRVRMVYDTPRRRVRPLNQKSTIGRHGLKK